MAYVKTWSTKEEVLKDLARASGRRIKKNDDLHEGYLVVGDAPPPVIVEDEDVEMQLLFGDAASRKVAQTAEDATPDLLGIQQMLQMVHDYNSGDDDDVGTNDLTNSSNCVIAISKVSKLNPNVQEFIPKSSTSSSHSIQYDSNDITSRSNSSYSKNIRDGINTNVVTQTDDVNVEDSSKNDNDDVKTTEIDVDVNNIKTDEFQDIATKLKNKISDAAKSDSLEFKRQKNVAIATLLRLYANNNKSPQKSTEPLKLFTPEYFEGKKEDGTDVKIETNVINKGPPAVSPERSTSSTPEPKNSSTTVPSSSSNSISSTPLQTSSENNLQEPGQSNTTTPVKIDPEIKRSIEKVNKWLEEPTKRKSPAVCLGPIAFKRKDPISCKSSISDSEQKVPKSASSNGQCYRPSNYAADLARKYMERNKIEEEKKKEVTWSNLQEVLKQKDLAIEKRLKEKAAASDTDDSGTSQR